MSKKSFFGNPVLSFNELEPIDYVLMVMIFITLLFIMMPCNSDRDSSGNDFAESFKSFFRR